MSRLGSGNAKDGDRASLARGPIDPPVVFERLQVGVHRPDRESDKLGELSNRGGVAICIRGVVERPEGPPSRAAWIHASTSPGHYTTVTVVEHKFDHPSTSTVLRLTALQATFDGRRLFRLAMFSGNSGTSWRAAHRLFLAAGPRKLRSCVGHIYDGPGGPTRSAARSLGSTSGLALGGLVAPEGGREHLG